MAGVLVIFTRLLKKSGLNMEELDTAYTTNVGSRSEKQQSYSTNNAAQRTRILDWLRRESLTTLQAREHLDIMHPAGRVKELRKQGFNIMTYWTIEAKHRIAKYVILAKVES